MKRKKIVKKIGEGNIKRWLCSGRVSLVLLFVASLLFLEAKAQTPPYQYDWPTLAHDMKRSGSTAVGPDGPYTKVWYRDFWSEFGEQVAFGYQPPVVRDQTHSVDLTYIATVNGSVSALNVNTGAVYWRYPQTGYVGNFISTPTVEDAIVYIASLDGKIYAIDGKVITPGNPATPAIKWIFDTQRAGGFWATPIVTADTVYIGGRDGYFYALNKANGNKLWEVNIGSPIQTSPAFDAATNILYFGAENMKAYAYTTSGQRVWESAQLAGQTMKDTWPVIVSDKVIFRTSHNDSPSNALWQGEQLLAYAAGCTSYPFNANYERTNAPCFNWKAAASSQADYDREREAVRSYLSGAGYQGIPGRPQLETFYVLNKTNGTKPYIAPVLWTNGNGEPGYPPVVDTNGNLWTVYRSYYSDYDASSWYIMKAFGSMDPATGNITIRNPNPNPTGYSCGSQSCNPWDYIDMISDEPTPFSAAGNKLYISTWVGMDTVNMNTGDLEKIIFGRDSGAGMALPGALVDNRNRSLPFSVGARPNGYNLKGPSIFGDKLMENSGSVIAMWQGHLPGVTPSPLPTSAPPVFPTITPTSVNSIPIPAASTLEHYIWEVPQAANIPNALVTDLKTKLNSEVANLLTAGRVMAPWVFIPGKQTWIFHFNEPAQTAYYLGLVYPYLTLSPAQDTQLKTIVNNNLNQLNQMDVWNANRYDWSEGLSYSNGQVTITSPNIRREDYPLGPFSYCRFVGGCEGDVWGNPIFSRVAFDRLYDLWLYAYRTGDWSWIESHWNGSNGTIVYARQNLFAGAGPYSDNTLLGLGTVLPGSLERDDSANRRVSSLIAYVRIAHHMGDSAQESWGITTAEQAMQARLRYINTFRPNDGNSYDYSSQNWEGDTKQGIFMQNSGIHSNNIPEYRDLSPEVGRLLTDYAVDDLKRYEKFVDTVFLISPRQRLGNNMYNGSEIQYSFPDFNQYIFLAKALASPTKLSGDQLRKYLDIPWVNEDYFYWERLTRTIEAYGITSWCDVRNGNCTAASILAGDVNQDNQINVLDVQACVNHILGIQDYGLGADVNGDGSVNVLDVQAIVNIILGV